MIVGPTVQWYIAGQFEWRKIRVATGFRNIRLFAELYFHKLELYVEVSATVFVLYSPIWSLMHLLKERKHLSPHNNCFRLKTRSQGITRM